MLRNSLYFVLDMKFTPKPIEAYAPPLSLFPEVDRLNPPLPYINVRFQHPLNSPNMGNIVKFSLK